MPHNGKKQIISHINVSLKKLNSALQEQEHVHQYQQKTLFSHLKIKRQALKFPCHNQNQQEFFLQHALSDMHPKGDLLLEKKESDTVLILLEVAQNSGTVIIKLLNLFFS